MQDSDIVELYKSGQSYLPALNHYGTASPGKRYVGKIVRYRRSSTFKVMEIGTNPRLICDFLLVFHCNYMSIC